MLPSWGSRVTQVDIPRSGAVHGQKPGSGVSTVPCSVRVIPLKACKTQRSIHRAATRFSLVFL